MTEVVKKSDAYIGSVHPDINLGMPTAPESPTIASLRASVRNHDRLEYELATLEEAIHSANRQGDFESGIELTAAYNDREHELAISAQAVWCLLRKEFSE